MDNLIKLDWETWVEKFKPFKNHLDSNAAYDGYMYETYEEELKFVFQHIKADKGVHVWTAHAEGDSSWINEGFHIVNRMGYFITAVPWVEGIQYVVDEDNGEEDHETLEFQVTYKGRTGEIVSVLTRSQVDLSVNDLTNNLAYYDNGSRGWRLHNGHEFRWFLQEESTDTEDVTDDPE